MQHNAVLCICMQSTGLCMQTLIKHYITTTPQRRGTSIMTASTMTTEERNRDKASGNRDKTSGNRDKACENSDNAYKDTLITILHTLDATLEKQHKKYLEAGVRRGKALKEYYSALDTSRREAVRTGDAYDRAVACEAREYDRQSIIFEIRLMVRRTIEENTNILGGK